jgi:hypothetical protein
MYCSVTTRDTDELELSAKEEPKSEWMLQCALDWSERSALVPPAA